VIISISSGGQQYILNSQDNSTYQKIKMLENNALNLLFSNLIYLSFLTYFEWSKKVWVHQFKLSNLLSTPSAIELCLKIFRSDTYFAKPNIYHTKLNIISKPCISFFVHFEQSLSWWVHREKVCNTFFKSKHNQDISKDFELFENWNVQTPTYLPSLQKLKKKHYWMGYMVHVSATTP
jgi:hypothetical protein